MAAKVKALQQWCKNQCDGYRDINITNMTSSWKSGLAFCAIIHRYRPDLIDYNSLLKENVFENNKLAFDTAASLGIAALLDPEDMLTMTVPDKLCIITYVSQYYNYFSKCKPEINPSSAAMKRPANLASVSPSPDIAKRPALVQNNRQSFEKPVQSNGEPKLGTLQDRCAVCSQKVYLMERHLENNQLYHRQCIRDQQKAESARYRRSVDELALKETSSSIEEGGENLTEESEANNSTVTTLGLGNKSQASSGTNLVKTLYSVSAYPSGKSEVAMETGKPAVEVKQLAKPVEANQADDHVLNISTFAESSKSNEVVSRQNVNRRDLQSRHSFTSRTLLTSSKTSYGTAANAVDLNQFTAVNAEPNAAGGDLLRTNVLLSLAAVRARSESNRDVERDHIPIAAVTSQCDVASITPEAVFHENSSKPYPQIVSASGAKQSTAAVSDVGSASDQMSEAIGSTSSSLVHSTNMFHQANIIPVSLHISSDILTSTEAATSSVVTNSLSDDVRSVVTVPQVPVPKGTTLPRQYSSGSSASNRSVVLEKTTVSPVVVSAVLSSSGIRTESKLDDSSVFTVSSDQTMSDPDARNFTVMKNSSSDELPSPKSSLTSVLPLAGSQQLPALQVDVTQNLGISGTSVESNASVTNNLPPAAMVRSNPSTAVKQTVTHPVIAPGRPAPPLPTGTAGKNIIVAKSNTLLPKTESSAVASVTVQKSDNVPRRPAPVSPSVNLAATVTPAKNSELVSRPAYSAPSRPPPVAAINNISNKPTSLSAISSSEMQLSTTSRLAVSKDFTVTSSVSEPARAHQLSTTAANSSVLSSPIDLISPPIVVPTAPKLEEISSQNENSAIACKPVPVTRRFISAKLPEQQLPVSGCSVAPIELHPSPVPNDLSIGQADSQSVSDSAVKQRPVAKPRRLDVPAPDNSSETCSISTTSCIVFQKSCSTATTSTNITSNTGQEKTSLSLPRRSLSLADRQTLQVWTSQKAVPSTGVKQPCLSIAAPLRPPPPSPKSIPADSLPLKPSDASNSPTVAAKPNGTSEFLTSTGSERKNNVSLGSPTPPARTKKAAKLNETDLSSPPTIPQPPTAINVEKTRQKITPDVTFTFEKDAFRPAPARSAPLRPAPPPPAGGAIIKRQITTEERLPVDFITQRLQQLDKQLNHLEQKGRALEERIRSQCDEMMDDDDTNLMSSWFKTVNKKNELVREETELMYRLKQQELEDQHSQVEYELRRLLAKPDHLKTADDKSKEAALLQQLMDTVSQRNNIVDSMEEDRIRYLEEDKEISQMMITKGLDQTSGKKKRR